MPSETSPKRRRYVPAEDIKAAFEGAPRVDYAKFRRDLDEIFDQDITPRT